MEKGIKERAKRLRWFAVADWQLRFQAQFLLGTTAEPLNSMNLRERFAEKSAFAVAK